MQVVYLITVNDQQTTIDHLLEVDRLLCHTANDDIVINLRGPS